MLTLIRRHPDQLARGLAQRGWPPEQIAACLAALAAAPDDAALSALARELPNLPADKVPAERTIIQQAGDVTQAAWQQPHWECMTRLGMLDAPRGTRLAGPRFTLLRGWGARLERALLAFMLDLHTTQHGYTEIAPPLLVAAQTLDHTGHLPHFATEMYALPSTDRALWLNPTAEVPLVALHAGELLAEAHLPLAYVAGMAAFRREAGSAGRATRGLLRLHQFQKVELVQLTTPAGAEAAYEAITRHAVAVLDALALPYRVVELPAPDLSFAAARGRDLEVWFPGMGAWIEVSSISLCATFQARRATIRYAPARGGKPRFVATLNASGLAVGRTLAALVEHGQTAAGAITLPLALRPYVGGVATITATTD